MCTEHFEVMLGEEAILLDFMFSFQFGIMSPLGTVPDGDILEET